MARASLLILAGIALFPVFSLQYNSTSTADLEARAALIPWDWSLQFATDPLAGHEPGLETEPLPTCPSSAQSLIMFAAVNITGAVCSLIFGNRRVAHILSFKTFGGPQSRSWALSVVFQIGFHVGAAFINAYLVSKTYGYVDVHTVQLAMLFLARPRLSWIPLTMLLPTDTYRNTAMATLCMEVILQLFGTYSMGITAHFASQNGYYSSKILNLPYGNDALLMYCGALLFLVNMAFSICAVGLGIRVYYNAQKDSVGLLYRPQAQEVRYSTYQTRQAAHSNYHMNSFSMVSFGYDTQRMISTEELPMKRKQISVPKHIAAIVTFLSVSCAGSWLFWVGFITVAGPLFCLPNVIVAGVLFALFSILSAFVGTGFA